jgi:hypothetical protein
VYYKEHECGNILSDATYDPDCVDEKLCDEKDG